MGSRTLLSLSLCLVLAAAGTAQMFGTYTLDAGKPASKTNFQSFAAALAALRGGGISGSVTIQVATGTYIEKIVLRAVTGAASSATITFTAASGLVRVQAPFWDQQSVLATENGAAWYRFTGIHFTGYVYRGLHLHLAAQLKFTNCTVDDGFSSLPNIIAVNVDNARNIEFENCTIRAAGTGILTEGRSCRFAGCEVDGKGLAAYCIRMIGDSNTPIDFDCLFEGNYVHSCGPAGYGVSCTVDNGGNMFFNNTIVVASSGEAIDVGRNQRSGWNWNAATVLRNNIFVNYGSGSAALFGVFSGNNKINQIDSDYNCFHAPSSKRTILVGNLFRPEFAGTLSQFRMALTKGGLKATGGPATLEANSIEVAPGFRRATRPYDVHLLATAPARDLGTALLVPGYVTFPSWSVAPDYENEIRDPNPDLGADEEAAMVTGPASVTVGARASATLYAVNDANRPYVAATSLGKGPLAIGGRRLDLALDGLLLLTIQGVLPANFVGYFGRLGTGGNGTIAIQVPKTPALRGITFHSAFLTLNSGVPSGIQSHSNTWSLAVK